MTFYRNGLRLKKKNVYGKKKKSFFSVLILIHLLYWSWASLSHKYELIDLLKQTVTWKTNGMPLVRFEQKIYKILVKSTINRK